MVKEYLIYDSTRSALDLEFYKIKSYLKANVRYLDSRQEELNRLLNEDIKENPDDIDILNEVYSEDIFFSKFFPKILRGSIIISILSYFESSLNRICDDYIEFVDSNIKTKHINAANNIERSRIFLKFVINVEIERLDKHWNIIADFWKIRNCIVHQNYSVKNWTLMGNRHDLYNIISKYKDISVDEKTEQLEIMASKDIEDLMNATKAFIEGTMNLIEDYRIPKPEDTKDFSFEFDDCPF